LSATGGAPVMGAVFLVPSRLRELCSLGGATVITGMGDCLEIWAEAAWERQQQRILEEYADLLEADASESEGRS